jgi:hypothetical protein
MTTIAPEQAVFFRPAHSALELRARSAGFADDWLPEVERWANGFGEPAGGCRCPLALFVQPLGKEMVALVRVSDLPLAHLGSGLAFHVVVIPRAFYFGDPFAIGAGMEPPWQMLGTLPAIDFSPRGEPRRTVAMVQEVLKRLKSDALGKDEDPETVERTPENSEGPTLLGGVQVLVDGGRLAFFRAAPDPNVIQGLWTLLPEVSRRQLWPATFAFSDQLGFDVIIVPPSIGARLEGYTTEEQAADYPAGHYEKSLQTAAESEDQVALDRLFSRRSPAEVIRLALTLMVVLAVAAILARLPLGPPAPPRSEQVQPWSPEQKERAALAAAMASGGEPWTALALHEAGRYRRAERFAAAAAIVGCGQPLPCATLAAAAQARYGGIWKPVRVSNLFFGPPCYAEGGLK